MSPNPSNQGQGTVAVTRDVVAALQAVHYVMSQIEKKAARILWHTSSAELDKVITAIMVSAKVFQLAVEKTDQKPSDGGTPGPDCRPGFHEEFGICVPDN